MRLNAYKSRKPDCKSFLRFLPAAGGVTLSGELGLLVLLVASFTVLCGCETKVTLKATPKLSPPRAEKHFIKLKNQGLTVCGANLKT